MPERDKIARVEFGRMVALVTEETACSPGTVQPNATQGSCDKCAAGKFQTEEGQQECETCTAGSYCAEGASAPLPCAEGTYSASMLFMWFRPDRKIKCLIGLSFRLRSLYKQISLRAKCVRTARPQRPKIDRF